MTGIANIPGRSYWFFPIVCGLAMCALQILIVLYRFGGDSFLSGLSNDQMWTGLGLFFVTGVLIGLLLQLLFRGTTSGLRTLLLVATVLATPFSVMMSLAGGLFGQFGVIIAGLLPFLLLVGIPRLIGKLWELYLWRKNLKI